MTTTATTRADVLADIERQLAALPGDEEYQRQLDDLRQKREALSLRIQTIRSATAALTNVTPKIAAEVEWRDHLIEWRTTLCDELLAFPPRIRDDRELGKQQNVKLSIVTIDRGRVSEDAGWPLERLRLGALMREAGYAEGPKFENQTAGRLPWFGSLPEVEARINALHQEHAGAQARLDDALLDDEGRAAKGAEIVRRNALPHRKTRGDGSQYDRYPDGHVVEVTA